jgi:hypothetical protein
MILQVSQLELFLADSARFFEFTGAASSAGAGAEG